MDGRPSPQHLVLLNEVYGVFRKDASWPVYDYLDRRLDQAHGLVIDDVVATMPEGLLRIYEPIREDREVMVRVAGMLYCDGADGDVELFMRALRWCVAKETGFKPKSPTASEQLNVPTDEVAADWAKAGITTTPLDFDRLRGTFEAEWIRVSVSGMPGQWSWTIPKDIRRFRPVRNVYDYLRVIAEDKPEAVPANPLVNRGPTILVQPPQQVRVVGGATALNDGAVLTVESLHPIIRDACADLFEGNHYRQGVLDAALALRDFVREESGLLETNDRTLISKALAGKHPRIVVSDAAGGQGTNMREGTAYLALGIFARLRNVLTHEKLEIEPHEAMEMVGLISRVARDVEGGRAADNPPS
jgi:uncharacterized protein (TIGR02391 family)